VKKAVLLVVSVLLLGIIGVTALAQCGCTPALPQATEINAPSCYTAYWSGVDVTFRLIVPAEYFSQCPTPVAPLITGWRVEKPDGTIVTMKQFPDVPKGHYLQMVWDQKDTNCNLVPPGFYRIVVQTTTAGEFANYVKIVPWPNGGICCCCCQRLVSQPCCSTCGQPYVQIERSPRPTVGWGLFSITIHWSGSWSCP